MKFKFGLDALLKFRKREEDIAKRDYLIAEANVKEAFTIIEGYYQGIEEARHSAVEMQKSGSAKAWKLNQIQNFIDGQKVKIENKRNELRNLMMLRDEAHHSLIEKATDHRSIVKLKGKRLDEFKKKIKIKELKMDDEISVMRHKQRVN